MSRTCTLMLASWVAVGGILSAQDPLPVDPLENNAALSYWQAFALLPAVDEATRKKVSAALSGNEIDDQLQQLVDDSEISLSYLHRGAGIENCSWGIANERGPYAYMPHLSKARELAWVALLRARMRFESDDVDGGIEDTVAALQIGRHAGQEGVIVLINILVGFAIESQTIETIAANLQHLDQSQRDVLAQQLAGVSPDLDMRRALQGEKDVFLGWLIREIEGGRSQDAILALVSGDVSANSIKAINEASKAQLLAWAEEMGEIYDAGFAIMALEPSVAEDRAVELIEELHQQIESNPLAKLFLPAFGSARKAEAAFLTRKALLKAAFALYRDGAGALDKAEHHDPFGDGPFQLKRVDGGGELVSDYKRGDSNITLALPGFSFP